MTLIGFRRASLEIYAGLDVFAFSREDDMLIARGLLHGLGHTSEQRMDR